MRLPTKGQAFIFTLGWMAYASTYFLRKGLGVVKADIQRDLSFSTSQLGWMDTAFIMPYATVQMLFSKAGDWFGAGRTFGLCLLSAGFSMLTFGQWSQYEVFVLLLLLNGIGQAMAWPNCCKVVSSWFSGESLSIVFSMLGTSAFMGSIMGTTLAVYLQTKYGWRQAFFIPSLAVIIFGVLVFLVYRTKPSTLVESHKSSSPDFAKESTEPLSVWQLWKIRAVPEIALSVFCLKLIRYSFYMWLPMYLLQELKYSKAEAGMFSTTFDIGGVAGTSLIGFFLNRSFHKQELLGVSIIMSAGFIALILFTVTSSWGMVINSILLFIAGACNCGPDTILAGSVAIEMGEANGRNSGAALIGFINGFGTCGIIVQGPIIGYLVQHFGWPSMFIVLLAVCAGSGMFGFVAHYKHKKTTLPK